MGADVVVVGSFVQDLTWRCAAFPVPGETILGDFVTGPGGKGSNQAVACSRTGVATAFLGCVGRDAFGKDIPAFYRAEGIEAHLQETQALPTATAGILVDAKGQNQIVVDLAANRLLDKAKLPREVLGGAKVVVCQHESNVEATLEALRLGREAGAVTVHNPAPMVAGFEPAWLEHVTVLTPNETEFVALLRKIDPSRHSAFGVEDIPDLDDNTFHGLCRQLGVPVVIVTLGAKGCFVSREDDFRRVPAVSGGEVVDTTGAGDAFVGGFASGLVQFGRDGIYKAARYGSTVAGISVTRRGATSSMPARMEIEALFTG